MVGSKPMQAIAIPPTSPARYISFKHALNLRFPHEDTGDWHFLTAFFTPENHPRVAPLAGEGEQVNTNPSLGELGVRDMGEMLTVQRVLAEVSPVYVANHYRAIADLAMLELKDGEYPQIATVDSINQWLDTDEQFNTLVQGYLIPLTSQLDENALTQYEQWLKTIKFQ